MREIELKILLDESSARALKARLRTSGLCTDKPRTSSLRSIYFDTPERSLRDAGISLRLRRDGRRWVQTVKTRGALHGGLSRAAETEFPAPRGRLDLGRIPDPARRDEVLRAVGDATLEPICETAMRRLSVRLSAPGRGIAELAIDSGEILAAGRSATLHEAEIELVEGNAGLLFDLALALFPEGGLRFSRLPKSARGYLLAEQGFIEPPVSPRAATAVPLKASETVETAVRDVLRECLDQIAENVTAVIEMDDPDGAHQLRIGLRRLRSALSVFGSVLDSASRDRLATEARWLGQEVGRLRDLDVAFHELLRPEAEANRREQGLGQLADRLEASAETRRKDLRGVLVSPRVQAFVIELARFVETRGWLNPADPRQTGGLARPIGELAREALRKQWKKVSRRGPTLEALSVEQRHELRKELKSLRYAAEFLAPIYPQKRTGAFISRLKRLQVIFGEANDARMLQEVLDDPSLDWARDGELQRPIGWAIGSAQARAAAGWSGVGSLWRKLDEVRVFWK